MFPGFPQLFIAHNGNLKNMLTSSLFAWTLGTGPWEYNTLGTYNPGNIGPWEYRTLGIWDLE